METQNYSRQARWIYKGLALTLLLGAESIYATAISQNEGPQAVPAVVPIENSRPVQTTQTTELHTKAPPEIKTKRPFDPVCRMGEVRVDFLLWSADEDGLEYGTKMIATPLIGAASDTKTRLLDLDFEWNPGFRLGAGAIFDNFDCWELDLTWTHMNNHAHGESSAKGIESQVGNVDTIISPWVNLLFELRAGASHAKAHWEVDYNTLDLDFGKKAKTFAPFGSAQADGPLLRLEGLGVSLPRGGHVVQVLEDVSLSVAAGEMLALVGSWAAGRAAALSVPGLWPGRGRWFQGGSGWADVAAGAWRAGGAGAADRGGVSGPGGALNPVMRVGAQIAEPLRLHLGMGGGGRPGTGRWRCWRRWGLRMRGGALGRFRISFPGGCGSG